LAAVNVYGMNFRSIDCALSDEADKGDALSVRRPRKVGIEYGIVGQPDRMAAIRFSNEKLGAGLILTLRSNSKTPASSNCSMPCKSGSQRSNAPWCAKPASPSNVKQVADESDSLVARCKAELNPALHLATPGTSVSFVTAAGIAE
jgi:hypothetical protein